MYFPEDALHIIFLQLFDLTGIWVAVQALAYGACEVHKGVSAFSPAFSRVEERLLSEHRVQQRLRSLTEALDQLPVLATCTMMQALVFLLMNYLIYLLSQLFTI